MDGNKEDALKCLQIGKDALQSGDRTRALKFINKARRLDPSLPVDDLLQSLNSTPSSDPQSPSSSETQRKPSDQDQPSVRNRKNPSSASSSSTATYTAEQVTIVKEIKRKKDYYEILGVEKSCSVEDVRKAYRKLSLKVHPDKNNAPGAEEAFKLVSKAFQCLSNEDNRKTYDLHGSDEPSLARTTTRHGGAGFNGFYDADVDAEEIFRNFFFGGMGPATTQFRSFNFGPGMNVRTGHNHGGGGGAGGSAGGFRMLLQLLPVLLIVLLNFMPSSQPAYSLSRQYPYEYRFTTQKGVNFYVRTTKFEQEYPPGSSERASLERKVDSDYYQVVLQNCRYEIQRKQWGFVRETPHCDLLRQYESAAAA